MLRASIQSFQPPLHAKWAAQPIVSRQKLFTRTKGMGHDVDDGRRASILENAAVSSGRDMRFMVESAAGDAGKRK